MLIYDRREEKHYGSYYICEGRFDKIAGRLFKKMPKNGAVKDPEINKELERLRVSYNYYHDLYANSLMNHKKDFSNTFGIISSRYSKKGQPYFIPEFYYLTEAALDRIVVSAAVEQKCRMSIDIARYSGKHRDKKSLKKPSDRIVGHWLSNLDDRIHISAVVDEEGSGSYLQGEAKAKYKIVAEDEKGDKITIHIVFEDGTERTDVLSVPSHGLAGC